MNHDTLKNILEGVILAADQPMNIDRILKLFAEEECPSREEIKAALEDLQGEYANRGIELKEVSSGYRFQVRQAYAPWVSRLWDEKPSRYSRALLETLALIAYRQPITRGEIEEIRGVSVSTTIMKTLQEREWVRVVGHRDVPGRPAMYATTRQFLDYFDLKSLDELPPLAELRNIDEFEERLAQEVEQKLAQAANEPLVDDEAAEFPDDGAEAQEDVAEVNLAGEQVEQAAAEMETDIAVQDEDMQAIGDEVTHADDAATGDTLADADDLMRVAADETFAVDETSAVDGILDEEAPTAEDEVQS